MPNRNAWTFWALGTQCHLPRRPFTLQCSPSPWLLDCFLHVPTTKGRKRKGFPDSSHKKTKSVATRSDAKLQAHESLEYLSFSHKLTKTPIGNHSPIEGQLCSHRMRGPGHGSWSCKVYNLSVSYSTKIKYEQVLCTSSTKWSHARSSHVRFLSLAMSCSCCNPVSSCSCSFIYISFLRNAVFYLPFFFEIR